MRKRKRKSRLLTVLAIVAVCFAGNALLLDSRTNTPPDASTNRLASTALTQSIPAVALANETQAETISLDYIDGSTYVGEVERNSIRNGTGTYVWDTGEVYTGEWKNDQLTGEGTLIWPDLGVYTGSFENGKREGQGTFTWTYDEEPKLGQPISFEGTWHNDKIGNKGKLILAGLGTYSGRFSRQVRSGKGVFTWENGDEYNGTWANDAITGEGVLTLADGTALKGTFVKGVLQAGTIQYAVEGGTAKRDISAGKLSSAVEITYHDGTFVSCKLKKGEVTGNAIIRYSSGDRYVGTLKNGMKDGKGAYTWKNGAHYVGEWDNDKMSGQGKYYYGKDETKNYLSGSFSKGIPTGKLTYIGTNKLKYETTWTGGKCTNIVYKK